MDEVSDLQVSRRVVAGQTINMTQWQHPDEAALPVHVRRAYHARKLAVSLFLQGETDTTILQRSSLTAKYAYRLIASRCLQIHEDGQVFGWRGLVPHLHIKPYKRQIKVAVDSFGHGAAGAMDAILDRYPELRRDLDARILKYPRGNRLESSGYTPRDNCRWFLNQLRAFGCEANGEWPFNTASRAYHSIRRYAIDLLNVHEKSLAALSGGPERIRKLKTGDGSNRPVHRFLQRVEMDAHKLDGRFCVSIPQDDGSTYEKIVHRLWVIVIIEIMSRAVLGYYFSLRKEVSHEDVLRCIKRALTKWTLKTVTFCDEPYSNGAGFPSTVDRKFVGLCWDETSVDGALAETCKSVEVPLREVVGSVVLSPSNSFSKRRSLDDRPFIEKFFARLAKGGFQRLSNTTGGKSSYRKGRNPDEVAITSRFQYEYAEELLDVLVANYNASKHSKIGGRTPLEYFSFLYEQVVGQLRKADPTSVESLFSSRKLCRVRGGAKLGRSCFVEYVYARYTNEVLQNRQDLAGSSIWVINHKEDDARVALAVTRNGQSLGVLRAAPPWNKLPHSLAVRKAICQLVNRNKFDILSGADGIESFLNFVEQQPKNKLPVHPSYLEVRRILSAAMSEPGGPGPITENQSLGADMPHPAEYGGTDSVASPSAAHSPRNTVETSSLPPRRSAVTRT